MNALLHDLILQSAEKSPDNVAIVHRGTVIRYAELAEQIHAVAHGLQQQGLANAAHIATYLPKQAEAVSTLFGASLAGAVFVPINPLLKARQVGHILTDAKVRALVTTQERAHQLTHVLGTSKDLETLILVGKSDPAPLDIPGVNVLPWNELILASRPAPPSPPSSAREGDLAAILYTSGSSGQPKGVMLSHRNLVLGAQSVVDYLHNTADDRLLAVLPLSFDYGLSQLTTAFCVGASVVLMEYLMPRDVIRAVATHRITGLAGVPTLWTQIAHLPWPDDARRSLRYLTNSGGAMPRHTLAALRSALPTTCPFLMYGLTEAFRSTYLPPEALEHHPGSIGRAIPNTELMVVREDGSPCATGEPGELVHRGPLVAMGYWNDPHATAACFRPAPGQAIKGKSPDIAVWSGDTVQQDEDGFFYFIGRKDHMIKTSGYRVSPTEVEDVIHASGLVAEAAALGVPHPSLGQAIVVVATPPHDARQEVNIDALMQQCKQHLPTFMTPAHIQIRPVLPHTPNGKIDRGQLATELTDLFQATAPLRSAAGQ